MRFMKMFGLAALAAVASMALVGVGSAAAQEHRVVFCEVNEPLCEEGNAWPDETFFLGLALPEPILLASPFNEVCEESHVAGRTLGEPGKDSLLVDIELLSFTGNCKECPEVLVENLPYTGHITHDGEGNYSLLVLNPLVLFHGCPIVGLCGYSAKEVHLELKNDEGAILALANEAELPRHAGSIFCPGSGKWDSHYLLLPSEGHEGEHLGNAWLSLLALNE
jgi:hypothetical protein